MKLLARAAWTAALVLPCVLPAQGKFPGIVLRLPTSTRMLAMGNVGVMGRDDDVLFYNPAQLVAARGTSVSFEQFAPGSQTGALSSVSRFNTGGIAIGAVTARFHPSSPFDWDLVDRDDILGAQPIEGSSTMLAVGIGQVVKSVRIGLAAKYVEDRVGTRRNAGGVVDVGVARDFFGYGFGLSVQNIGPDLDVFPIGGNVLFAPGAFPIRTTLGASRSLPVGQFDVFASAGVSMLRDFYAPAGGVEVGYSWLDGYNVFGRVGARRPERGEGALTAGAGFSMDRLSIDYAVEALSGSRFGHRFGLRVR